VGHDYVIVNRAALGAVIIGASLVLVGCSSPAPKTYDTLPQTVAAALATAQSQGFKWEVSILKDGTITSDEYEQAYDRYLQCAANLGYVVDHPKYLDPVNGLQWESVSTYRGTGKAPDAKVRDCENRLGLIETPYVLLTPKRMDPRLLVGFRKCLDDNHLPYTGKEVNYNEFVANRPAAEFGHGPYMDCLFKTVYALFPDAIGVSVSR
jgi:hypothetical protein